MTDNEIIKALECCIKCDACENCPYFIRRQRFECGEHFNKDVLDLINRQKEEIERLREALAKSNGCLEEGIALAKQTPDMVISAITEAVREFAERLKKTANGRMYRKDVVYIDEIDNLVKETVGAESG